MISNYNAIITREGDIFVSWCPELDIASRGNSKEEARYNLKEALDLFIAAGDPLEVQKRLKNNEAIIYPMEVNISHNAV
ncbi:MAG: type II toxin-antitoxin system HicB family antitoxin [bacterium]